MNYLLDTNILSDARRRSSPALNNWLSQQRISELSISAITIFELEKEFKGLNAEISFKVACFENGLNTVCERRSLAKFIR